MFCIIGIANSYVLIVLTTFAVYTSVYVAGEEKYQKKKKKLILIIKIWFNSNKSNLITNPVI